MSNDSNHNPAASPTVTGIIIFLNGAKYLREAIESVRAQTFTDWELILCDDGSTDGATDIAKQYASRYPDKIRYLEHPNHENRGMSATRMLGVANSSGKYVTWLDSDDRWKPNKLERQVEILESHPEAALVYGPLTYWYSWSGEPKDRDRDFQQNLGVATDTVHAAPEVFLRFIHDIEHHPSGVMVRRKVLEETGGYEPEFRRDYEDVVAQTKVCLNYPVYAASESWYLYRQHPESCCAGMNAEGRARRTRLIYLRWLERYLSQRPSVDARVSEALQQELAPYAQKTRHAIRALKQKSVSTARTTVKNVAKSVLPKPLGHWIRAKYRGENYVPPTGHVDFGSLRRPDPIDRGWGWHRGLPADRYYIESFLDSHRADIRGHVMEVADAAYTDRFGGPRVTAVDVLHVAAGMPGATIIGNLETGENIPHNAFDCIVLTQVLPFLFDVRSAMRNCRAALRPGGVLLLTVPGISQISIEDRDSWGDFWRFTSSGIRRLLTESFANDEYAIETFGNVLSATSFLYGLSSQDLKKEELEHRDEQYEVIIAARAVKGAT